MFDESRLQGFAAKYSHVGFGINFKKQSCAIFFQKSVFQISIKKFALRYVLFLHKSHLRTSYLNGSFKHGNLLNFLHMLLFDYEYAYLDRYCV